MTKPIGGTTSGKAIASVTVGLIMATSAIVHVYLPYVSEMGNERRKGAASGRLNGEQKTSASGSMWKNMDGAAKGEEGGTA
eukprot:CAMPEP_0194281030 /NCGR_PEP_ID=MMETSP0169-20130528/19563_1 /TAXON_ID=218684 /ORGANISM="Corethron pennatum, Strain L29A3" /LENGTH=80 /DNA_ID=CAMNT_0039025963 /DNA_START=22 /DNA_END=264 /DNA_ORIENTATION=+